MCLHAADSATVKVESEGVAVPKGKRLKNKSKAKEAEDTREEIKHVVSKGPPHVSVAAIVGGMSAQKQRRIIDRGVDVLVATPGRLWDILEDVSIYVLSNVIRFHNSVETG